MKNFAYRAFRLIIAWLVGFCLASFFHTQAVMSELTQLGIRISTTERLSTVIKDLIGMAPTYGLVIFCGLTVAFSVAWLLQRRWLGPSIWWFAIAGGIAMASILLAMYPLLNVTLLAGARTTSGFILQVLAGVSAGLVYASLRKLK